MGLSLKANTTMQTRQWVSITPFPKFLWLELVPLNFLNKQTNKKSKTHTQKKTLKILSDLGKVWVYYNLEEIKCHEAERDKIKFIIHVTCGKISSIITLEELVNRAARWILQLSDGSRNHPVS